jgi:plastocyanin
MMGLLFMSAGRHPRLRDTAIVVSCFVVILAVGLLAVSCGGSTTQTTAGVSTTAAAPGTTAAGGTDGAQVVMKNFAFNPASVTIKAGESVTWTNNDSASHTVEADNGEFKSGDLAQGGTFSFKFDTPGTYPYHCSIHPSMKGTIVVQ